MKKTTKNIFLLLGLALGALSIVANLAQWQQARKDARRMAALSENTGNGEAKIIDRYIRDSVEHVTVKEVYVQSKAEKEIAIGSGYLDTLTRALQVATKQIEEVTKVNARLTAQNMQLVAQVGSKRLTYQDKYLALSYDPDSNTVDMSYDAKLNVVKYWKRSWLLGEKKRYIDIFADDPRVSISSVKRLTIAPPAPKRWGLGVQAGYGYSIAANELSPYLGLGLSYNLIRF